MSIILLETHQKIVRKARKRAFIIHGILVLTLLVAVLFPRISKIENDLIRASYWVVRQHLVDMESRNTLLEILRNKPLSIGQALEVADVIMDEARASNVPIHVVLGVMSVESKFNTNAVSSEGATGLMQVMASTWNKYVPTNMLKGPSARHNPALNVRFAVRYLGDLIRQHGDLKKVLTVYGGFVNSNPDKYVNLVMANAEKFKVQLGGD